MEEPKQAGPPQTHSPSFGHQGKPLVFFYKLERELTDIDTYSTLGYLRSSFEFAIIRLFENSSSAGATITQDQGFVVVSIEEALMSAEDSWIIAPGSIELENEPHLEMLKKKAGLLVAARAECPEISRLLFYGPMVKTDSEFLPPRITHWGQLFAKIMVLSAVQKSPSIWNKSLAFLRYHSNRVQNGAVLQDAYPLYFSPVTSDNSYFKISSKDNFSLLSENIPLFPLNSLGLQPDVFKITSATITVALLGDAAPSNPTEGSLTVHMVLSPKSPPVITLLEKDHSPAGAEASEDLKTIPNDSSEADQGYLHLNQPVGALFDSFVLGQRVITSIRDIRWPKQTKTPAQETKTTGATTTTAATDTTHKETPDAHDLRPVEQSVGPQQTGKDPLLSSRYLTNLNSLARKRVLAAVPILPGERDNVILELAEEVRRQNSLDSSHGLRVLYLMDKDPKCQEQSRPRLTILGVAGLFSDTWGGLSPSDLATLHGPLVETLQTLMTRSQKGAPSRHL